MMDTRDSSLLLGYRGCAPLICQAGLETGTPMEGQV